jgi:hypothetical protein
MTFKARRSARNSIVFLAAFGLMAAGGVAAFLFGYRIEGIAVFAFGVVVMLVITAIVISPNSWYRIAAGSLQLRKGFAGRSIPLSSLRAARVVPAPEVAVTLREFVAPVILAETSMDPGGWAKAGKRYGRVVRFCSVPIVESRTSLGSERNVVQFDLKVTGEFVVLELDDGFPLLISPQDSREFARELRRQVPNLPERRAAAGDAPDEADGVLEKAVRDRRRRYWTMVGITSVPVLLAVALLLWTNLGPTLRPTVGAENGDAEAPVVAEPALDEWTTNDRYRASYETSTSSVGFVEDADERKSILRETIDQQWPEDLTVEVMGYFLSRSREELEGERYFELRERVLQEVSRNQPYLIRYGFDDDIRVVTAVVDLEGTDLRNIFVALFSEYVELELAE